MMYYGAVSISGRRMVYAIFHHIRVIISIHDT